MKGQVRKLTYLVFPENRKHLLSVDVLQPPVYAKQFQSGCNLAIGAGIATYVVIFAAAPPKGDEIIMALAASTLAALLVGYVVYAIAEKVIQARVPKYSPPEITSRKEEPIKINDVQRVDSATHQTHGTGRGVGVNVGYGVAVGGGQMNATTTSQTSIGWQFYTSRGIISVDENMYNNWLNAGRPTDAIYLEELEEYK